MEIWNRVNITKPPDCTLAYSAGERRTNDIDVCAQALIEGVLCGHATLCRDEMIGWLQRETAILTALLFQNGRLRTEKFYRVMKKVHKSLARWHEVNLFAYLENLRYLMPAILPTHKSIRLPSKQMFEYLLVRVLGGFHLLLCIDGYCQQAAVYLMAKISSGHFFATAMAFLANVARIRVLALDLAKQLAKLYDDILPWVHSLKGAESLWRSATDTFPPGLTEELQKHHQISHNVNLTKSVKKSRETDFSRLLSIFKDDGSEPTTDIEDLLIKASEEILKSESSEDIKADQGIAEPLQLPSHDEHIVETVSNPMSVSFLDSEDIGECVEDNFPRKSTKILHGKSKKNTKKRKLSGGCGNKNVNNNYVECASEIVNNNKYDTGSIGVQVNRSKLKRKNDKESVVTKPKKKKVKVSDSIKKKHEVKPIFCEHYLRVNRTVKKINSVESVKHFLVQEKKNRQGKVKSRVSYLLKKDDWILFSKMIRNRIKNVEALKVQDLTTGIEAAENEAIAKTKTKMKFWLLYPQLKGRKPQDWSAIIDKITVYKKSKSRK